MSIPNRRRLLDLLVEPAPLRAPLTEESHVIFALLDARSDVVRKDA